MQSLTTHGPMPSQFPSSDPPLPANPPVYILGMMSYGMEYSFGQFGPAVLAVSPPNVLCPSSLLAGWA